MFFFLVKVIGIEEKVRCNISIRKIPIQQSIQQVWVLQKWVDPGLHLDGEHFVFDIYNLSHTPDFQFLTADITEFKLFLEFTFLYGHHFWILYLFNAYFFLWRSSDFLYNTQIGTQLHFFWVALLIE